jgi:hypothetical protein
MEIFAAIVGGFLAAGTGWFVQSRIEAARESRHKQLLLLGIKDDITNSLELYDQLIEDWERSRTVWFNLLTQINDSRHIYVNNRSSIVLIKSESLRNRILQYYRKSGNHLLGLQNAQQRKYDIQSKYNLAVQNQQLQNHDLTLEAAQALVVQTMAAESDELTYWDNQLPFLVAGIQRFKDDAREIRELLKNEE